jgi:hypothetical protein
MHEHRPAQPAPSSAAIAQRLLAHARLCVEIAQGCWNDETAARLRAMARECTLAAAQMQAGRDTGPQPVH